MICDIREWVSIPIGFRGETLAQHSTAQQRMQVTGEDASCGTDMPDDAVT